MSQYFRISSGLCSGWYTGYRSLSWRSNRSNAKSDRLQARNTSGQRLGRTRFAHLSRRSWPLKLRPGAFRSEPGTDDVSVIRHTYMGSDFCKDKAKEIANKTIGKTYKGLAVITVEKVRRVGAEVIDSRHVYYGHAHISYGIVAPPPDEPAESQDNKRLLEMTSQILRAASYFEDTDPAAPTWTGPAL